MSSTNEHFNRAAATWDVRPEALRRSEAVAEYIRDKIRPDRDSTNMLDFGCGTGQVSILLRNYVRHITAIDSAEGMLDELRRKISEGNIRNIEVKLMDIAHETHLLTRGGFDLIISQMVMHHIENVTGVLVQLRRLLSPKGVICLTDLEQEDGTFHDRDMFIPHKGFAREQFSQYLQDAGFYSINFFTPFSIKKKAADGVLREFPLFMAVADNFPPSGGGNT